jgi:hypothetical protein
MLNLLVSWVCKIALKITLVLNQNSFKCLLDCVSQKTLEGDRDNTVCGGDKACKSSGPTPPSALIILNSLLSFPAILQE